MLSILFKAAWEEKINCWAGTLILVSNLVLQLKRQVVLEWVLVSSLSSVLVYPIAEKKVRCVSKSLICQPCLLPLAGDLSPLSFLDPTIHWFLLLQ